MFITYTRVWTNGKRPIFLLAPSGATRNCRVSREFDIRRMMTSFHRRTPFRLPGSLHGSTPLWVKGFDRTYYSYVPSSAKHFSRQSKKRGFRRLFDLGRTPSQDLPGGVAKKSSARRHRCVPRKQSGGGVSNFPSPACYYPSCIFQPRYSATPAP